MAGPGDYHSKWSKSEWERQIWYHLNMESKFIYINWHMFVAQMHVSIKPTHRRKEQTCGCQGGGW